MKVVLKGTSVLGTLRYFYSHPHRLCSVYTKSKQIDGRRTKARGNREQIRRRVEKVGE